MEWFGPLTILPATVNVLIVNGLAHPAFDLHMLIISDNLGTTLKKWAFEYMTHKTQNPKIFRGLGVPGSGILLGKMAEGFGVFELGSF